MISNILSFHSSSCLVFLLFDFFPFVNFLLSKFHLASFMGKSSTSFPLLSKIFVLFKLGFYRKNLLRPLVNQNGPLRNLWPEVVPFSGFLFFIFHEQRYRCLLPWDKNPSRSLASWFIPLPHLFPSPLSMLATLRPVVVPRSSRSPIYCIFSNFSFLPNTYQ